MDFIKISENVKGRSTLSFDENGRGAQDLEGDESNQNLNERGSYGEID